MFGWILGRYLATSEDQEQRIGTSTGVSMLGLDALSSSAYGPEAALTVLLPLGALGTSYVLPITAAIIALLFIVYFSYKQTIAAYPNGGGSYTVAKENLGDRFGVLAAAALLLDYVLTVAVGISAGVGALISALPQLQPYTLPMCIVILVLITVTNLRGIKESGFAFLVPTYAFIFTIFAMIAFGLFKYVASGGHPVSVEPLPPPMAAVESALPLWLLLKAFASGCTAMTGVEAVSNGVKVFKEPVVRNAERTLTLIILILAIMLGGIAFLANAYGVVATPPGDAGYESMISQLLRAIFGRGTAYYVTIAAVTAVLCFSANTGFADFPRLCQILAHDNYLPHAFSERGRRLVFSHGILGLASLSGLLLLIFGGVTDRLIPLYAIGAFLAFTLSQAGMVGHWWKQSGKRQWRSIIVNAVGAFSTGLTLLVVLFSKFTDGGWITVLLIPGAMGMFFAIHNHYKNVEHQLESDEPVDFNRPEPIVIIPLKSWNKMTRKALEYGMQISDQVYAVHVDYDGTPNDAVDEAWAKFVAQPCTKSQVPLPQLVHLPSPYRIVFGTLFNFIDELEAKNPDRRFAIVLPLLAERRWYNYLLHNQRAALFSAALFLRADPKIVIMTVPWYLN